MSRDARRLLVLALGVLLPLGAGADGAGSGGADDAPPPAAQPAQPDGKQKKPKKAKQKKADGANGKQKADRAKKGKIPPELLERWKAMSPEQRKRLKELYRKRLRSRTPEERERLRQLAKRHLEGRRRGGEDGKHRRRRSFERFAKRLIEHLPPEERAALKAMTPEQRKAKLRQLVLAHREAILKKQIERLPAEAQQAVAAAVEGKKGGQRYREAKRAIERFVRARLKEALADTSLDDEARRAKASAALEPFLPNQRQRERLIQRFLQGGGEGHGPWGPNGRRPGRWRGPDGAGPGPGGAGRERFGPRGRRPGEEGRRWRGRDGRRPDGAGPGRRPRRGDGARPADGQRGEGGATEPADPAPAEGSGPD